MERIYLKLYNPNDTYMSPASVIMDAAGVLRDFPAAQLFPHIVHTDEGGEMLYGFYSLSAMKSKYGIDKNLVGAEAVQAVEDAMNKEQRIQEEEALARAEMVTPEERIAAALEFQALANLPDVEGE